MARSNIQLSELQGEVSIETVDLSSLNLSSETQQIFDLYQERFPSDDKPGNYSVHDWRRISYVSELVPKVGSFLDVGVGCGQFVNLLGYRPEVSCVIGGDLRPHTKYIYLPGSKQEMRYFDVTNMPFENSSFDTVTCMEVLEHLEFTDFLTALRELRRVSKNFLYMTVPWQEPYPLFRAHHLRFDFGHLIEYFPNAEFTLLDKGVGNPWMLIYEANPDPSSLGY